MKKDIPDELILKTKEWLGESGILFFTKIKDKYGKINACFLVNGFPHPVHFREGLQVRNFMVKSGLCEGWTVEDYDENWIELIEKCISKKIIQ